MALPGHRRSRKVAARGEERRCCGVSAYACTLYLPLYSLWKEQETHTVFLLCGSRAFPLIFGCNPPLPPTYSFPPSPDLRDVCAPFVSLVQRFPIPRWSGQTLFTTE